MTTPFKTAVDSFLGTYERMENMKRRKAMDAKEEQRYKDEIAYRDKKDLEAKERQAILDERYKLEQEAAKSKSKMEAELHNANLRNKNLEYNQFVEKDKREGNQAAIESEMLKRKTAQEQYVKFLDSDGEIDGNEIAQVFNELGYNLPALASIEGEKLQKLIGVVQGTVDRNDPEIISALNELLSPQIKKGVGSKDNDGKVIKDKSLAGLYPGLNGGLMGELSMRTVDEMSGDESEVFAPITEGRDSNPDANVLNVNTEDAVGAIQGLMMIRDEIDQYPHKKAQLESLYVANRGDLKSLREKVSGEKDDPWENTKVIDKKLYKMKDGKVSQVDLGAGDANQLSKEQALSEMIKLQKNPALARKAQILQSSGMIDEALKAAGSGLGTNKTEEVNPGLAQFLKDQGGAASETLESYKETATTATKTLNSLALLSSVEMDKASGVFAPAKNTLSKVAQEFGVKKWANDLMGVDPGDYVRLNNVAVDVGLGMLAQIKGPPSEGERAFVMSGLFSNDKSPEQNRALIKIVKQRALHDIRKNRYIQEKGTSPQAIKQAEFEWNDTWGSAEIIKKDKNGEPVFIYSYMDKADKWARTEDANDDEAMRTRKKGWLEKTDKQKIAIWNAKYESFKGDL